MRLGAQRGREDEEADVLAVGGRGWAGVVQELLPSLPPCGRRLRPIRHTFAMPGPEHSPGERPERGRPSAPPPHRRAHTSARDLERYAGLFAARTQVMRSSAMRDLMAITARPEVISLAGGLPDTSTFPPETFAAQMTRIAQESSAEALQYGPTEGFERDQGLHRRGDGGRGDGSRPRRHHRHDRRPAGDRPRHQDARRPRRRGDLRGADLSRRGAGLLLVRGRDAPGRDGRGRDADRRARGAARPARGRRAAAEVHLLGAELPEPRRGDAVGRAPAAAGRAGARARGARRRGQPLRPAALRGRAAAAALPARRRRLRASTSARSRRSSPRESASAGRSRRRR